MSTHAPNMSPEAASICEAIRKVVSDHTPLNERGAVARDAVSLMDALQTLAHVVSTHAARSNDGSHHVPFSALTLAYWDEWVEAAGLFMSGRSAFLSCVETLEENAGDMMKEWQDEEESERQREERDCSA